MVEKGQSKGQLDRLGRAIRDYRHMLLCNYVQDFLIG